MAEKEPRLSKISKMHYGKLVLRGSVFLAALAVYVPNRLRGAEGLYETFAGFTGLIPFVWVVFMADMICRMFPAKVDSMGSQKLFRKNYRPTGERPEHITVLPPARTALCAGSWFLLNGLIFILFFRGILEIYGTASGLTKWYWIAGAILLMSALLPFLKQRMLRHSEKMSS